MRKSEERINTLDGTSTLVLTAAELEGPVAAFTLDASGNSNSCGYAVIMTPGDFENEGPVRCRERQGGVLKYYYRDAA